PSPPLFPYTTLFRSLAHPGEVGGEAAALGDHPAIDLALQGKHRLRLHELDRGDIRCLEILEQRPAARRQVLRPPRVLLIAIDERAAAEEDEQHDEHEREARVPAAMRRRRINALAM